MGKPITKSWFGTPVTTGSGHIKVNGVKFADGTTATNAYIVKQTGSNAYIVQDTALSHAPEIVYMVNAASLSTLLPGQCYILATPYGGSALPCAKIAQFKLSLFDVVNTVPQEVGSPAVAGQTDYTWSTIPAASYGQANLISGTGVVGEIQSVAIIAAGRGYFSAPTVTFTGAGGSGATAHTTIANGSVSAIIVDTAGYGYADGGTILSAPPASVTATVTATVAGGAVTGFTGLIGGGYYLVAPTVSFGGPGTGASATAVISNGTVTGFTGLVGGTGYTTAPTVTLSAPPAATQATAIATVSVD